MEHEHVVGVEDEWHGEARDELSGDDVGARLNRDGVGAGLDGEGRSGAGMDHERSVLSAQPSVDGAAHTTRLSLVVQAPQFRPGGRRYVAYSYDSVGDRLSGRASDIRRVAP